MAETIIKNLSADVGFVKIHLPDHTMSSFMIAQSLGEEFGVETNYDALKKLRAVLRNSNNELYKNVKTDCEGGCVFIHTSSKRAEEILRVAILINENAIEPYHVRIDDDYIDKVKQVLMTWKRPKPQKWKVGDVFTIGLSDDSFSFGQVVWERYKEPNCALFDCRSRVNIITPLEDLISSPVISVLQLGSECLDSFEWKVIGNTHVNIDKKQVPLMHRGERSYSAGILSNLAEAYYGLEPWNSFSNDELLMPKIKRPKSAFFLTHEQLEEYYKTKDWK